MKLDKTQLKSVNLFNITQHFKRDTAQRTLNDCVVVKTTNKARDNALNFFERVRKANKCLR